MTIELHIDGIAVKLWYAEYTFGPFPAQAANMRFKELSLQNKVLECKVDAGPLIYSHPYQMYAVLKSKLRADNINANEYGEFLITVAKNKNKK